MAVITGSAAALRYELSMRSHAFAKAHNLKHCLSYGDPPVVCYEPDGPTHGNFFPATYRAILQNPLWARRLKKVHTGRKSLPKNDRGFWAELDSCTSSDALLMNVFCFPGVFDDGRVYSMLGVEPGVVPDFGWRPRVRLVNGNADTTEVDMRLRDLLVEAKLAESDFQVARAEQVERYLNLKDVFTVRNLPRDKGRYLCYQLIRNVLAAEANRCSFCVLFDERRPDLREQWFAVMSCVRLVTMKTRCKALTWQELASVLPKRLQRFLEEKYGIG